MSRAEQNEQKLSELFTSLNSIIANDIDCKRIVDDEGNETTVGVYLDRKYKNVVDRIEARKRFQTNDKAR